MGSAVPVPWREYHYVRHALSGWQHGQLALLLARTISADSGAQPLEVAKKTLRLAVLARTADEPPALVGLLEELGLDSASAALKAAGSWSARLVR
jgi:hypothetical protein